MDFRSERETGKKWGWRGRPNFFAEGGDELGTPVILWFRIGKKRLVQPVKNAYSFRRSMPSFSPKALFQQVAEEVLRQIAAGELHEVLPGEETLAARFGVSRPVLRQALQELRHQGVIAVAKGKKTRILSDAIASNGQKKRRRILVIGTTRPTSVERYPVLGVLQAALEQREWQWDESFRKSSGDAPQTRRLLNALWEKSRADCALLLGSTAEMQAWAMTEEIPALVLGSLAPGIVLPSVDVHYYALGWHAGGRFAAAGRNKIFVFVRHPMRMGDHATLHGLRDFCASISTGMEVIEVGARPPAASLVRQFDKILKTPAEQGWFFIFPQDAITAYTYLFSRGHRIPREVALISREAFPWIEAMTPSLAHYQVNRSLLIRRAVRILDDLALGVTTRHKSTAILPQFVPGETLELLR